MTKRFLPGRSAVRALTRKQLRNHLFVLNHSTLEDRDELLRDLLVGAWPTLVAQNQ
jgi:hypothetical protein